MDNTVIVLQRKTPNKNPRNSESEMNASYFFLRCNLFERFEGIDNYIDLKVLGFEHSYFNYKRQR